MSTKFHYVYRVTNTIQQKHYYGKRTSTVPPIEDIGIKYFTSSSDKEFKQDFRQNTADYEIKVIRMFSTAKNAVEFERRLHRKFSVAASPSFYNRAIQTSSGFDTTGRKNTDANKAALSKANKGTVPVVDKDGNRFRVPHSDPRYLSGELVAASKGRKHTNESKAMISKAQKGSNNRNAFAFEIYDSENNLVCKQEGGLKELCLKNNLPYQAFLKSIRRGGEPLYINNSPQNLARLQNNGNIIYKDWYGKRA